MSTAKSKKPWAFSTALTEKGPKQQPIIWAFSEASVFFLNTALKRAFVFV